MGDVVGCVNLEAFVSGDGGRDVGDEGLKGGEGSGAEVVAWTSLLLASYSSLAE